MNRQIQFESLSNTKYNCEKVCIYLIGQCIVLTVALKYTKNAEPEPAVCLDNHVCFFYSYHTAVSVKRSFTNQTNKS